MTTTIFTTSRLAIRLAGPDDAALFFALWTSPAVMGYVGFPRGLPVTCAEIADRLHRPVDSPLDALLVAQRREDSAPLGECKLGRPNSDGIATTDVKLLPRFWGQGYGTEIKAGLLDYLFTHTDCRAVEATPNVANTASIRMQEAVGGVPVGKGTHTFPPHMADHTVPVSYVVYHVSRTAWQATRQSPPDNARRP